MPEWLTDPLFLIAMAAGLYMAWNIGANDVANAFGTSVGSGALTFKRALILAAIFEFSGAFFVGSHVTGTIRGDIVVPDTFSANPQLFAVGMLSALIAASLWLNICTYLGQPVSTTHAIIGAVIGFGIAAHGPLCIQWHKMGRIAASWFVSPVVGAFLAFLIYSLIKRFVLGHKDPVSRAKIAVPLGLGAVIFILGFSVFNDFLPVLMKGHNVPACMAALLALFLGLLGICGGWAATHRRQSAADSAIQYTTVERWFGRLQIMTACYMSFAHGANDVANAIGPLAGVFEGLRGVVVVKTGTPAWLLAIGGIGIVAGLATYGYKVIEAVGKKITEVTPTRGFSAEFGTATTVLVCSLLGLPISTTFVLVGAVMGVGFARGFGAINLRVVRHIFMSWLITIPASAIGAALIYLLIVHVFGLG